jgi:hypothetical protein
MHSSLNTDFTYNGITFAHNTDQEAIAIGDNFLSQIVPIIMASKAYQNNGAIVIWFDETERGNTTSFTVPEIVVSPLAKGNAFNSTLPYTHSSDLKTLQELLGVSAPGGGFLGDANTPGTNDLSDFFLPGPGATVQGSTLFLVGGNTNDQLSITPTGSSPTGSTGINVLGSLNNVNINQTFTGIDTIYVVGFGGNDRFQFARSLTITSIVTAGDGSNHVQLDNGNDTVNLGDGNNSVQLGQGDNIAHLGNGNNLVTAGTGNNNIQAGNGSNLVIAGAPGSTGSIQVHLGDGAGNLVSLFGDGNDQVQAGNGAGDSVSIVGNGNDQVKLGDGNADAVSIIGNGNDQIQLGNGLGDFVFLVGNGDDSVQTGTGSGIALIFGAGQKNVSLGSSAWLLI